MSIGQGYRYVSPWSQQQLALVLAGRASSAVLITGKQTACTYQSSQPVIDKTRGLYYILENGACLSYNLETEVQGPNVRLPF